MPRYARIFAALPLLALGLLLTQCADSDPAPTTTPPVVSSTAPTSSATPSPMPTTPAPEPTRVEVPDPPPAPPVPAKPARVTDDDSSGGSAYYKNCGAARAAGAAPLHAGEPGLRLASGS